MLIRTAVAMLGVTLLAVLIVTSLGGQANAAYSTYRPDLSVSVNSTYWASYSDYLARDLTVDYEISNGSDAGGHVHIDSVSTNNGVTVLGSLPVHAGDIMPHGSLVAGIVFDVPAGVSTFTTRLTASAAANGNNYNYPLNDDNLVYMEGNSTVTPIVEVFDTSTSTVVNQLVDVTGSLGQSHRNQVSPDGRYVWNGENGPTGRADGYVQVLDARTGVQVKRWDVGNHNGPTMSNWTNSAGHHYLFFPVEKANGIINIFDVEAQEFLGSIPVGENPGHMWDTTPDGHYLWGTVGSGATSRAVAYDISQLESNIIPTTKAAEITIGGSLHAVAADLVRERVYVGSSNGGVNVIDTTTNTVIAWKAGGIASSHNFTPSPDGQYLLVGESNTYGCSSEVYQDIPTDGSRGPFLWALNLDTLEVDKYFEAGALMGRPSHHTYTHDGSELLMSSSAVGSFPLGISAMFVLDPNTLVLQSLVSVTGAPHTVGIAGGSGGLGGNTY